MTFRTKILLFVGSLAFFSQQVIACNVNLAVSTKFSPYLILNKGGVWSGVSIDLAKMLVEKAGCQLKFIDAPWIRAIKLLETGEVQLLTNFSFDEKRAEFAEFIGPHYIESAVFIARKETSKSVDSVAKLADFDGLIGVQRGANFGVEFEQAVVLNPKIKKNLIYLPDLIEHTSMLTLGRLDGLFDDELVVHYMLEQEKRTI